MEGDVNAQRLVMVRWDIVSTNHGSHWGGGL